MTRRRFIRKLAWTGAIFVPTWFHAGRTHGGSMRFGHLDWEAGDWVSRVRTASPTNGMVTASSVVASDLFIKLLKSSGIRTKVLRANLFCGDRVGGQIPQLLEPSFINLQDSAFAGSSYSEVAGWTMNAATEYIYTGFNPSAQLTANSAHLSLYLGGTTGAHTWIPIGTTSASDPPNDFFMTTSYTSLGQALDCWTNTGRPEAADTNGLGFYLGSRTSGSSDGCKIYKNGTLTGTSSSVGNSPPNIGGGSPALGMLVMNCRNGGVALGGAPNTKSGLGYSFGTGLTGDEGVLLYNAFQRANTILGR